MSKSGQATVPSTAEQVQLFEAIRQHRHPEKNTAIMQISFKLALRVQEIALLEFKEVCELNPATNTHRDFKLHKKLTLPAAYTKGANAIKRSQSTYQRKTVSFKIEDFNRIVEQIEALAKANSKINPEAFYPSLKKHKGKSRVLDLVDLELREALSDYILLRIKNEPTIKPTDPLFITQKGGSYSPNTLQEHMALMLRKWTGIEKASSHSGRRSVLTDIIHKQGKPLKVAQKIAGHVNPSTTIIYTEPRDEEISEALKNLS